MKREKRGGFKKRGFTLIEMVVVLVMVSVIAAIAVPSYLGYVDDTRKKECETNMKRLVTYLDDALLFDDSATMQGVIEEHSEIRCPSRGEYRAEGTMTVTCTCEEHKDLFASATSHAGGTVSAQGSTEKDNARKEDVVSAPPSPSPTPLGITLAVDSSLTLKKGNSQEVLANVTVDVEGADVEVTWTSGDESIATVEKVESDPSGQRATITAKEVGTCTIRCTAKATLDGYAPATQTQEIQVTVEENPKEVLLKVALDSATVELEKGESATIQADVTCTSEGADYSNYELEWTVANLDTNGATGNIAEVVPSGDGTSATVTGLQEGKVQVTCKASLTLTEEDGRPLALANGSEQVASAEVTVKETPKQLELKVSLDQPSATLEEEATINLTSTVVCQLGGVDDPNYALAWSVDNDVVKLDPTSAPTVTVTALKAGTAIVTCKATWKNDQGIKITGSTAASATATVIVTEKPKAQKLQVTLDQDNITVATGATNVVKATVTPADAQYTLIWESTNEDKVEIGALDDGNTAVLTGVEKGNAQITCIAEPVAQDGSYEESDKATATVNVEQQNLKTVTLTVTLTPAEIILEAGRQTKVTAEVESGKQDYRLSWKSSAPDSVSVSPDSNNQNQATVTALQGGSPAMITCTATLTGAAQLNDEESSPVGVANVIVQDGNTKKYATHTINGDGYKYYGYFFGNKRERDSVVKNSFSELRSGSTVESYYLGAIGWYVPILGETGSCSCENTNVGTTVTFGKYTNWGREIPVIKVNETPTEPNIEAGEDGKKGNRYTIKYKKTETVWEGLFSKKTITTNYVLPIRVVYPCKSLEQGNGKNETLKVGVGQTLDLSALMTPKYTTDTIQWSIKNQDIVQQVGEPNAGLEGDKRKDTLTVQGLKPGKATVTALVTTEMEPTFRKGIATYKLTWDIEVESNVNLEGVTVEIKPTPVVMQVGVQKTIQLHATPEIDWSQVDVSWGQQWAAQNIQLTDHHNGTITLMSNNPNDAYWSELVVKAGDKSVRTGNTRFIVTDDPSKVFGFWMEPTEIELEQDKTATIAVYPNEGDVIIYPLSAGQIDPKKVTVTCTVPDWQQGVVEVQDNVIHALTPDQQVTLTIQATDETGSANLWQNLTVKVVQKKTDPSQVRQMRAIPGVVYLMPGMSKTVKVLTNPGNVDWSKAELTLTADGYCDGVKMGQLVDHGDGTVTITSLPAAEEYASRKGGSDVMVYEKISLTVGGGRK